MAKEILKLNDFSGGINKAVSARDIEDNQLVEAQNIDVSKPGLIRSSGVAQYPATPTSHTISGTPPAGTGLFTYGSDYRHPTTIGEHITDNSFSDASAWTVQAGMDVNTTTSGNLHWATTSGTSFAKTENAANWASESSLRNDSKLWFMYYCSSCTDTNITTIKLKGNFFTEGTSGLGLSKAPGFHSLLLTANSDIEDNHATLSLEFEGIGSGTGGSWVSTAFYLYSYTDMLHTDYFMMFDSSDKNWDFYTTGDGPHSGDWEDDGNDYDGSSSDFGWGEGSDSGHIPVINVQDGIVRTCDANFANDSLSRWRGYVNRALIGNYNEDYLSKFYINWRLPGFWNQNCLIEKPQQTTAQSTGFNTSNGTPSQSDDWSQIGISVNYVELSSATMLAGLKANSSSDGIGDAAYSNAVDGDFGSGGHNQLTSFAYGYGGSTSNEMGENVADSANAYHDAADGYYLYPKVVANQSGGNGNQIGGQVFGFHGADNSVSVKWQAEDYIRMEVRGFHQANNSWEKSFYIDEDWDEKAFYMFCGIMGNGTSVAYNAYGSAENPCDHSSDCSIEGIFWRYKKIPEDWSNDNEWHLVSFHDNSWNASGYDGNHRGWRRVTSNGFDVSSDWYFSSSPSVEASVTGVGCGVWFHLASTNKGEGVPENDVIGDHEEGWSESYKGGLKTHTEATGGYNSSGAHLGIRNIAINRAGGTGDSIGKFKFWYSWLYDDSKIESGLTLINHESDLTLYEASDFKMKIYIKVRKEMNRRIQGARVYFQKDDDVEKFMMCEIDLVKGYKPVGDEDFISLTKSYNFEPFIQRTESIEFHGDNGEKWSTAIVSYSSNKGTSDDLIHYRYKTALNVNRRMYIGNVAECDDSGKVLRVFGDRLCKSSVNKFDSFPESNKLDFAINDGDEIIHLAHFAERILIFKKRHIYVMNISGDFEFLETQFSHLGVRQSCQVSSTELGVIWVNTKGIYLYDGSKVSNLIEGRLEETDFDVDESKVPSIGYDSKNKKVIVAKQTTGTGVGVNSSGWLFCLKTFSIIELKEQFSNQSASTLSNFITNNEGEAVYANQNNIYKWSNESNNDLNNTGGNDKKMNFTTKDFTFDNPSVRKKIHKIYVTYKTKDSNNSAMYLTYAKDGSGSFEDITTLTGVSNYTGTGSNLGLLDSGGSFVTAEIKPSSSLTVKSLQLKFDLLTVTQTGIEEFEIEDISVVYRNKSIR